MLLLLLTSFTAGAQDGGLIKAYAKRHQAVRETPPEPELRFSGVEAHISGDSLCLSFHLSIRGRIVGRGEALHLVPVYESPLGVLFMPEILIQDRLRDSFYRRDVELMSKESYLDSRPYSVVVLSGMRTDEQIDYRGALYLSKEWREAGGVLRLCQLHEDCCDLTEVESAEVAVAHEAPQVGASPAPSVPRSRQVVPPLPRLRLTPDDLVFFRPQREAVKVRSERMTVRIQFKVARHEILPAYAGNARELGRVRDLLHPLLTGQPGDIEVTSASIRGYASPEGGYESNKRLSERRALAFKSYLVSHYGTLGALSSFPAVGMGEDWEGLRAALDEAHDVPMRSEMLAIIDYVDLFGGREKQLMDLAGGRPYLYMLEHLYPPLRRMEMEVSYHVRGYLPEEVEAIYDRRPQDLSQAEIYEVAMRRSSGTRPLEEYGRELDVAADYFPDDPTALLNAASAALIRGEYALARRYLDRIADAPEASLTLALYHWQMGEREAALRHLDRALEVPQLAERARRLLRQVR